ncbi:hypothetical protein [Xanthocytophaga flava]|uniref:hypothetical protein n=1 Tax=Xanthocytophaga flava TaxID=3048013 RepID=UPI0028D2CA42|nr:hypothetical protein [Xanthocytophaga flavus]MDJ1473709.1 hypothetical protein [Xanthocytophaga flavus]
MGSIRNDGRNIIIIRRGMWATASLPRPGVVAPTISYYHRHCLRETGRTHGCAPTLVRKNTYVLDGNNQVICHM